MEFMELEKFIDFETLSSRKVTIFVAMLLQKLLYFSLAHLHFLETISASPMIFNEDFSFCDTI